MKKPLLALLLCLVLSSLALGSCSVEMQDRTESHDADLTTVQTEYDVAFFTDGSSIDSSYNAALWRTVSDYAREYELGCSYAVPADDGIATLRQEMEDRISAGADVLVCYGAAAEVAVYELQTLYPKISFVLLEGSPHAADYSDYFCAANVCALGFAEQELGFLAGYLAVSEGYHTLGFLGGLQLADQVAYGNGFVQGVNYAYASAESYIDSITVYFNYSGAMSASEQVKLRAGSWYTNGVQMIFCSGGVEPSVIEAADRAGALVCGVGLSAPESEQPTDTQDTADTADSESSAADSAQPNKQEQYASVSLTVLSLETYPAAALNYVLRHDYEGSFPGGQLNLGLNAGCIGLDIASVPLSQQGLARYQSLCEKMLSGEVVVQRNVNPQADPAQYITAPEGKITLIVE